MNLQDIKKLLQEELKPLKNRLDQVEKKMATKDDLKSFATKDDLKVLTTKKDLNKMADRVTEDIISVLKDSFELIATKKDLQELEKRVERLEQN